MPTIEDSIRAQLPKMLEELKKRADTHHKLDRYYSGNCELPKAIVQSKLTKAYRMLMPVAEAPWGSLVVDSTQDRLEVGGIRSEDAAVDEVVWGQWQDNQMDAEFKVAQNSALVDGRAFALVWPEDEGPEVFLDNSATTLVRYREGSRRHRVAAVRQWEGEDERKYATLYRPEALYKFVEAKEPGSATETIQAGGTKWQLRPDEGAEDGILPNPYGVVPVVEIAINRRLVPGPWGSARGEFAHCLGLIDRINLLTFLGLVVAFWMGFPLRGVIGERILKDDEGNVLKPFDALPDSVAQIENPEAKTFEFKASDRGDLSVVSELDQLATITKTPRHYFPMSGGFNSISADAIRASEGGLNAKVTAYKASMGEGAEEILRLLGMVRSEPVLLSPRAEIDWKDHESRSMAERADAATKVASLGLPWQAVAAKNLNWTQDEINRAEAQMSSAAFSNLLDEVRRPVQNGQPETVAA